MADFKISDVLDILNTDIPKERAKEVIDIFSTDPMLAALRNDTAKIPVTFVGWPRDGAQGEFKPEDNKVTVATARGGGARPTSEILETVIHELGHAQQYAGSRNLADAVRTQPKNVAIELGYSEDEATKLALEFLNLPQNYASSELPVRAVALRNKKVQKLRATEPSRTPSEIETFANKYPEFFKRYAEVNTNPNRPLQSHYKGVPEMSVTEKVLNSLFGVNFEVDHRLSKFK